MKDAVAWALLGLGKNIDNTKISKYVNQIIGKLLFELEKTLK